MLFAQLFRSLPIGIINMFDVLTTKREGSQIDCITSYEELFITFDQKISLDSYCLSKCIIIVRKRTRSSVYIYICSIEGKVLEG